MKPIHAALVATATASALAVPIAMPAPAAASGLPVFDVTNYAQNLLQAARALDQVNNQLTSLQNEASMLQNMAANLKRIDFPQLQRMTSAMQRVDRLMDEAKGIQFKVDGLDRQMESLFPGALKQALTGDQRVAEARARLDSATAAWRQAMRVQAGVAQNVEEDSGLLNELAARSQSAAGALAVGQSANQLLALGVKQQLQLQNLMATEFREAALDRARRAQAEEDGRAATRRFLDGPASH
ncbi:MAG TPA: P-type conjugative transfer protein TrbJ [Sphingomicrobium sp.]|nr:P-type conjugative transfer protein TrbJ [Sphingomicrobium sp.]